MGIIETLLALPGCLVSKAIQKNQKEILKQLGHNKGHNSIFNSKCLLKESQPPCYIHELCDRKIIASLHRILTTFWAPTVSLYEEFKMNFPGIL